MTNYRLQSTIIILNNKAMRSRCMNERAVDVFLSEEEKKVIRSELIQHFNAALTNTAMLAEGFNGRESIEYANKNEEGLRKKVVFTSENLLSVLNEIENHPGATYRVFDPDRLSLGLKNKVKLGDNEIKCLTTIDILKYEAMRDYARSKISAKLGDAYLTGDQITNENIDISTKMLRNFEAELDEMLRQQIQLDIAKNNSKFEDEIVTLISHMNILKEIYPSLHPDAQQDFLVKIHELELLKKEFVESNYDHHLIAQGTNKIHDIKEWFYSKIPIQLDKITITFQQEANQKIEELNAKLRMLENSEGLSEPTITEINRLHAEIINLNEKTKLALEAINIGLLEYNPNLTDLPHIIQDNFMDTAFLDPYEKVNPKIKQNLAVGLSIYDAKVNRLIHAYDEARRECSEKFTKKIKGTKNAAPISNWTSTQSNLSSYLSSYEHNKSQNNILLFDSYISAIDSYIIKLKSENKSVTKDDIDKKFGHIFKATFGKDLYSNNPFGPKGEFIYDDTVKFEIMNKPTNKFIGLINKTLGNLEKQLEDELNSENNKLLGFRIPTLIATATDGPARQVNQAKEALTNILTESKSPIKNIASFTGKPPQLQLFNTLPQMNEIIDIDPNLYLQAVINEQNTLASNCEQIINTPRMINAIMMASDAKLNIKIAAENSINRNKSHDPITPLMPTSKLYNGHVDNDEIHRNTINALIKRLRNIEDSIRDKRMALPQETIDLLSPLSELIKFLDKNAFFYNYTEDNLMIRRLDELFLYMINDEKFNIIFHSDNIIKKSIDTFIQEYKDIITLLPEAKEIIMTQLEPKITNESIHAEDVSLSIKPETIHSKRDKKNDTLFDNFIQILEKQKIRIEPPIKYKLQLKNNQEFMNTPKKGMLYIYELPHVLEYKVINPSGEVVIGTIDKAQCNINTMISNTENLQKYSTDILNATLKQGNTLSQQQRDKFHSSEKIKHHIPIKKSALDSLITYMKNQKNDNVNFSDAIKAMKKRPEYKQAIQLSHSNKFVSSVFSAFSETSKKIEEFLKDPSNKMNMQQIKIKSTRKPFSDFDSNNDVELTTFRNHQHK